MEFGVNLPTAGPLATAENILKVSRWAEELGFHSLWATDHVVLPQKVDSWYPYGRDGHWTSPASHNWLDPLLALSWAASVAPSCKLGTDVVVAPLRNPMLLAKQLSTLDYLSGGRVLLGIGTGWMEEEFNLIGVPFAGRSARTVEMVRLMRAFWSGETVRFQGKYWQVANCMMYPLPERRSIPVYWGGHSEAALRRVARVGDGWLPLSVSPSDLRAGVRKIRTYCEQSRRDPDNVSIVIRPGNQYKVDAEHLDAHRSLGIMHWIVDDPTRDPTFNALHEEMQRVAELCKLPARR
jgi:probable F420-dependent oxidoreductase